VGSTFRASAPGKVMVSGEYAVLSGARALVLAVGARATADVASTADGDRSRGAGSGSLGGAALPPEVVLAKEQTERALGLSPMTLSIDTSALREGDRKLGLGSSAAGAVAAAAAVMASAGLDPAAQRDVVFRHALAGHHAVAPHGSGADVASASYGGLVRFRRPSVEIEGIEVEPRAMPRSIDALLVWTGTPVRTSELVDRVRALAARDPSAHRRAIDRIAEAAEALDRAFLADDASAIVDATRAHHDAMGALGAAADAPIVTPALAALAEVAARVGGASKPSGAGGGDVALMFVPAGSAERARTALAARTDLRVLPLALGDDGARREHAST
jgi:phosphomevalonate kinase